MAPIPTGEPMNGRPSSFGNSSPTPAAAAPVSAQAGADLTARFEQLRRRREQLQQTRMRHELKYEQAQAEEAQCKRRAQELGAESIEELEQMIEKAEAKARQELADFEAALDREQALLEDIERKLSEVTG